MGLDQWLVVKTKRTDLNLSDKATGVCSGLFGITCVLDGEYELGYLRKGYDQSAVITENCNCTKLPDNKGFKMTFTLEQINDIINIAKNIIETHTFDEEDGYDISEDYEGWETFNSKCKWEDTVEMFTKAKELLEQDPDAIIEYKEWS